ncbi:MAG: TonB-dependent receptor [Pseudomonadota bacterium]
MAARAWMVGALTILIATGSGLAQTSASSSGIRTFEIAFFASFNVQTALEAVQQVPGFTFQDSDSNQRGFTGSSGNVLLNQRRPRGKSDELSAILQRIPLRNIERIELVRGGAPGYQTAGQAVVVNIVLKDEAATTRSAFLEALAYQNGVIRPSAEFSQITTGAGRTTTLGVEFFSDHNPWKGTETITEANENLRERRRFRDPWYFNETIVSLNHEQALGSKVYFGTQARTRVFGFERKGLFRRFTPDTDGILVETAMDASETDRWGEDIETTSDLFVTLRDNIEWSTTLQTSRFRFRDSSFTDDGEMNVLTTSRRTLEDREFLGRTTFVADIAGAEFSVGYEGAHNSRDQNTRLHVDEGEGPVPIDLPGSTAKVTEERYEAFSLFRESIDEGISVEAGLRYEWSTLGREGVDSNERNFSFVKPELRLRLQQTPRRQFFVNGFRDVSQLSFLRFLSQIDFNQGQLEGGNPTLSPDSRWRVEASGEQSFANGTNVSLLGFHEWVSDVIDRAPVFDGTFDAPANIGDATRHGFQGDLSVPLTPIGLRDARLDVSGSYVQSTVTDPVTGDERRLSEEIPWSYSIEYRQTFGFAPLTVEASVSREGDETLYRLTQVDTRPNITNVDVTFRTTHLGSSVISVGISQAFEQGDDRTFENYVGDRSSGDIDNTLTRIKRQPAFFRASYRRVF